jgi:hypothetical protein
MIPLEEVQFMTAVDDTETSAGLAEDDKDFLKSLETMVAEIESEAENSN